MARLNDDAQWIVLMGFLVSFSLFFLALIINQSTIVGQSTSESVIEFPKSDVRDISHVIKEHAGNNGEIDDRVYHDIINLSIKRKGAVVNYTLNTLHYQPFDYTHNYSLIHYNNGVTIYNENWTSQ
ncbi:MAG: hypothetical protein GYA23_02155 [Methanomicrobiales archaeon]|nr:hypothetical protein [Methanomicrobiales archaeon]